MCFYQLSTSELYGKVVETLPGLSERMLFNPREAYGIAKIYGYWISVNYCEACGMYVCNRIPFNLHESPHRSRTFVMRKISRAAADIHLGNLDTEYDSRT